MYHVALNMICSTVHVLYQYIIIVVSWALSKVIGWLGIFTRAHAQGGKVIHRVVVVVVVVVVSRKIAISRGLGT